MEDDFTEELYKQVAVRMFEELEQGKFAPAGIISMFEDEESQSRAALLFHTSLPNLENKADREKALHDIVYAVKKYSYDYHMASMGADMNALKLAIDGKKALEELARTRISLDS